MDAQQLFLFIAEHVCKFNINLQITRRKGLEFVLLQVEFAEDDDVDALTAQTKSLPVPTKVHLAAAKVHLAAAKAGRTHRVWQSPPDNFVEII